MIARYWSARLSPENLPAYRQHLERSVFPELKTLPGFVRAELLTRADQHQVEVAVISVWQSLDAIDAFARPDRDAAVVAPAAAALLVSYDRRVHHYEIAASA